MEPLAINISPEALNYIETMLSIGKDLGTNGKLPVLLQKCDARSWDEQGTIQVIPYEHFQLVWCSPKDLTEFQGIEIDGTTVMIHPYSVESLSGKRLELKAATAVRLAGMVQDEVLVPMPTT